MIVIWEHSYITSVLLECFLNTSSFAHVFNDLVVRSRELGTQLEHLIDFVVRYNNDTHLVGIRAYDIALCMVSLRA